jgi:hypothetical protein
MKRLRSDSTGAALLPALALRRMLDLASESVSRCPAQFHAPQYRSQNREIPDKPASRGSHCRSWRCGSGTLYPENFEYLVLLVVAGFLGGAGQSLWTWVWGEIDRRRRGE